MSAIAEFSRGSIRQVLSGGRAYRAWMGLLALAVAVGVASWVVQARQGLVATHMRDPVSWAFYTANFNFLVGVAGAAVLLVIPAYVYQWGPIKEVVVLAEVLATSALGMCLLFVLADMGRPERFLNMLPGLGTPAWRSSVVVWDAAALNVYLVLNLALAVYLLFKTYRGEPYRRRVFLPLVLLSVPAALSIHTVTAFVYDGMAARPYWSVSSLPMRFVASAFCSGPAVMLVLLQVLRRAFKLDVKQEAIRKVAELVGYAIFVNLFLLGSELFQEYYQGTHTLRNARYFWSGIGPHRSLVTWAWLSLACNVVAFFLFLVPRTRNRAVTLNLGCLLVAAGVYVEQGIGLVIPGMTPDPLGEIYEYAPAPVEWGVAVGILGLGAIVFTVLVKVAVPILVGTFRAPGPAPRPAA